MSSTSRKVHKRWAGFNQNEYLQQNFPLGQEVTFDLGEENFVGTCHFPRRRSGRTFSENESHDRSFAGNRGSDTSDASSVGDF